MAEIWKWLLATEREPHWMAILLSVLVLVVLIRVGIPDRKKDGDEDG